MRTGFNGHDCGQTPGVGEGWGGLAGCRPRGHRQPDTTERPNSDNRGEGFRPVGASSGATIYTHPHKEHMQMCTHVHV